MPSEFTAVARSAMKKAANGFLMVAIALCWLAVGPARAEEICTFPTPNDISIEKELLITDLSVVNDARSSGPDGAWSFGGLMRALLPQNAPDLVKQWLDSFDRFQRV